MTGSHFQGAQGFEQPPQSSERRKDSPRRADDLHVVNIFQQSVLLPVISTGALGVHQESGAA